MASASARHTAWSGIDLSSHRYRAVPAKDGELWSLVKELANKYRRFGYRRLHLKVLKSGISANHKAVQRVYQEEGLQVRRRKRKKIKYIRQPMAVATAPNQVWSMDFVWDRTVKGQPLKFLVLLDAFTKELLVLEPATSMGCLDVIRLLEDAFLWHGKPLTIRSDNGTEYTTTRFITWTNDQKINHFLIHPGRPMQNGMV